MNTRLLGTALVFTFGSAIGCAAARFVVPPANAQQAATLTKWEYMCIHNPAYSEVQADCQAAGLQGWELAAVGGPEWCFKRPKM